MVDTKDGAFLILSWVLKARHFSLQKCLLKNVHERAKKVHEIRFELTSESDIYLEFEQPSTTVSQSNRDFHVFFRRKSVQSQKKVLKYDARALE